MSLPTELSEMYGYQSRRTGHRLERPLPNSYVEQVLKPILSTINVTEQVSVLDIASGRGEAARQIKESLPSAKVFVTDVSYQGLSTQENASAGLYQIQNSGDELPLPNNSVDFIHCKDGIVHFTDLDKLFAEFHRVLKPQGKVSIAFIPTEATYRVLIAGQVIVKELTSLSEYYNNWILFKELSMLSFGYNIGPPFFLTTVEKILNASASLFNVAAQGTWHLENQEKTNDWYSGDQTYRSTLLLIKK